MRPIRFLITVFLLGFILIAEAQREQHNIAEHRSGELMMRYVRVIRVKKLDTTFYLSLIFKDRSVKLPLNKDPSQGQREIVISKKEKFELFTGGLKKAWGVMVQSPEDKLQWEDLAQGLATGQDSNGPYLSIKVNGIYNMYPDSFLRLGVEDLSDMMAWLSSIRWGSDTLGDEVRPEKPAIPAKASPTTSEVNNDQNQQLPDKAPQTIFNTTSKSVSNKISIDGKWFNLVSRNDYPDGSFENGVTGDYEPIKIESDGTWSYYGKRRNYKLSDFTAKDAADWGMKSDLPKYKIILEDFSNGPGIGYIRLNPQTGEPERLVIQFKIYSPKEGTATWTQYRK